jgi:hypothetical protein
MGVYVEYWGLVDAPDGSARSRYERSMRWKMAQYRKNGTRFASLYPGELHDTSRKEGAMLLHELLSFFRSPTVWR